MKKLKPKTVHRLCWLFLLIGAIIALCGIPVESNVFILIGLVVMCCTLIFRVIFYRCPHCGKYLDRSTGLYCPYCRGNVNE